MAACGSKSPEVPARSYLFFGGPFRCSSLLLGGATTTLVGERLGYLCGFKAAPHVVLLEPRRHTSHHSIPCGAFPSEGERSLEHAV